MSGRVSALEGGLASDCIRLREPGKEGVLGRLPLDRELLQVNDLVSVHDLLDKITRLLIVHRPDLLDLLVVSLFELLKALLKLDELVCEQLVVLCEGGVEILGICHLDIELNLIISETIFVLIQFQLQALLLLVKDCLALIENLVVEAELLLVELVDGLHVFHALLKNLHLSLKLDLLLGLLVGILAHDLLELSRIVCLLSLTLLLVFCLNLLVLLEKVFDFSLIALENVSSLSVELLFNGLQLLVVVFTHVTELRLHRSNEKVNVNRHLLDGLDIVAVLLCDLTIELLNELHLIGDNLGTGGLLRLNVLFESKSKQRSDYFAIQ